MTLVQIIVGVDEQPARFGKVNVCRTGIMYCAFPRHDDIAITVGLYTLTQYVD